MSFTFSGKTALLAGGACDLGLALAPVLVNRGIRPVITCRRPESIEQVRLSMAGYDGMYSILTLDLDKPASLDRVFADLTNGLDYLVDFAQEDYESLVASADQSAVARYMGACVTNRALMLKKAARMMMRHKQGRFVFVSSTAAGRSNPGQGFYAASKLAAEALYRNLALELGNFGISTVTLRPGYVEAGRGKVYIEKNRETLRKRIPSGNFLRAQDVASTLLFLLSDQAKGFNATELVMDGGLCAGK